MKKTLLILLTVLFFVSIQEVISQAPQTYAGTYVGYGPTTVLPITVTGFTDMAAFDLKIDYDETILQVLSINAGPLLPDLFLTIGNEDPGIIIAGWINIPSVTLPDNAVLFEITFGQVASGTSPVSFDNTGNNCTYENSSGIIIDDDSDYHDGSVTFWDLAGTIWTGANSTEWSLPTNWNAGGVPTESSAAIIPDGLTNYPSIFADDAICGNLSISGAASLDIEVGGALTVAGDFVNDGVFTIRSTIAGDGSFIDEGNMSGSGTVAVERYLQSEAWHNVSSPITGGLSGIFFDIYLMEWDEPNGEWYDIIPTNVELPPLKGYAAWPDNDLTGPIAVSFESSMQNLNSGIYSTGELTTDGPPQSEVYPAPGFNLVGNPYPSAMDWTSVSSENLGAAIYIWYEGTGQYASWSPAGSNLGASNIIPVGQGFFVHAPIGDWGFPGSFTVDNNARVHGDQPFFKDTKSELQSLKLSITSDINSFLDETVITFIEEATSYYDLSFDAYNLWGNASAPDLYFVSSDEINLSINGYPVTEEYEIIPLNCKIGVDGYYTIDAIELLNFSETSQILLEDKYENIYIDLTNQEAYTFFANSSDDHDRFNLHFLLDPVSTIEIEDNLDVQMYATNNTIYLKSQDSNILEGNLSVYDVMGRQIISSQINGVNHYELPLNEEGILIVTYFDNLEQKEYRQKVYLK